MGGGRRRETAPLQLEDALAARVDGKEEEGQPGDKEDVLGPVRRREVGDVSVGAGEGDGRVDGTIDAAPVAGNTERSARLATGKR